MVGLSVEYCNVKRYFFPFLLCAFLFGCGGQSTVEENAQDKDPVVELISISYVKRTSFDADELVSRDITDVAQFRPGAGLIYQVGNAQDNQPVNISDSAFFAEGDTVLPYDVKDLEASNDGKFLVFSLRAPALEDVDDDEQPTWNIWQYEIVTKTLTRLISSDILAEQGQDTSPYYLPDGRIIFSSTRQSGNKSILLDEGKPQYRALDDNRARHSSLLHVMDSDGSNIKQISYSQGHDIDPVVLTTGKILFSRWEQRGRNSGMSLYQMDSDGKGVELVYGRHSHEQDGLELQFIEPREMPDGHILLGLRTIEQTSVSTHYVTVDITQFIDNQQRVDEVNESSTQAQTQVLFANSPLDDTPSLQGQFNRAVPLHDGSGRLVVGWSQCRIVDPDDSNNVLPCTADNLALATTQVAPPLFGYWLYNGQTKTQTPLVLANAGDYLDDVVTLEDKPFPHTTSQPAQQDLELALEAAKMAVLDIRSVYDFSGQDSANPNLATLSNSQQSERIDRPAQFVRVIKAVSIPDDDTLSLSNRAFGRSSGQSMRDILGYAPIEPDGSVRFKMPANMAFSIEIINSQGVRFSPRHESWLQLAPGEIRKCNGCHKSDSRLPHGLINRGIASINQGASSEGAFPGSSDTVIGQTGETMAQARARSQGVVALSPDLNYADIWSDVTSRVADDTTSLTYNDLTTPLPISANCQLKWQTNCRISIHFPVHIQPLFEKDRPIFDDTGLIEISQNRCTACHSTSDNDGLTRIPLGQLDLSSAPSIDDAFFTTSYRELLVNDNEQEIVNDILLDKLVPVFDNDGNQVFELDDEGKLVLDAQGQPIAVMQTVGVAPSMSVGGGANSQRFLSLFNQGASHEQRLSPAELRLITEWLDLGAQYYNDPFAVPVN